MASIAPFQGLRYNLAKLKDASSLIAPPYDVISPDERTRLEKSNERNIVRLDLPRGEGDGKYDRARKELDEWISEGTLTQDTVPAIYRYVQDFEYPAGGGGKAYTRKGFIALLRLEPFAARVVLPHEHTLSGPKEDRRKLMNATRAHFSQVFGLYRDPQAEAEAALTPFESRVPALDATTPQGRHRLWLITDGRTIGKVAKIMSPKQVLIADGHHRYETMLGLAAEIRPAGRPPGASLADWGPVFFARAEDPGLVVLPTHRLIKGLPLAAWATLAAKAPLYFNVSEGTEATAEAIEARLLREGGRHVTLALRQHQRPQTVWLTLRPDADLSSLGPEALRKLDVSVLHGLLLGPLLGIDAAAMAKQSYLTYTHELPTALAQIESGTVQAGFLMNATKVHEVLSACEAGFVLPQKSTYFEPKLGSGIVVTRIDSDLRPFLPQ